MKHKYLPFNNCARFTFLLIYASRAKGKGKKQKACSPSLVNHFTDFRAGERSATERHIFDGALNSSTGGARWQKTTQQNRNEDVEPSRRENESSVAQRTHGYAVSFVQQPEMVNYCERRDKEIGIDVEC